MRYLAISAVVLLLGGVAAACALWAGVKDAGAVAVFLGGAALTAGIPVLSEQLGRWGVPGDVPPLLRHRAGG